MRNIFLLCLLSFGSLLQAEATQCHLSYSYDCTPLKHLTSSHTLSAEALKPWEAFFATLPADAPTRDAFYTYICVAEQEAALLSLSTKGALVGSFDPLLASLTHLFFPKAAIPFSLTSDPYSEALSELIFSHLQQHFIDKCRLWHPEITSLFPFPEEAYCKSEKAYCESCLISTLSSLDTKYWLGIADNCMASSHCTFLSQLHHKAVLAKALSDAYQWALLLYETPPPAPLTFRPYAQREIVAHVARLGAAGRTLSVLFPEQQEYLEALGKQKHIDECLDECFAEEGAAPPVHIFIGLIYGAAIADYELAARDTSTTPLQQPLSLQEILGRLFITEITQTLIA